MRTIKFAFYSAEKDRLFRPEEALSSGHPIGALHFLLEDIPGVERVANIAHVGEDVPKNESWVGFAVIRDLKDRDPRVEQVVHSAGLNMVYK